MATGWIRGWKTSGLAARAALCAAALTLPAAPALAQTAAGTVIVNVAELRHADGGTGVTVRSNPVALRVDATIDVTIVARDPALAVDPQTTGVAVAFDVTNRGNAPTTFTLTADADGRPLSVVADSDGDGSYDATRDSGTTLTLAPGQTARAFAILADPVAAETRVAMTAAATPGTGAPGTVLPGVGPEGVDAVVGPSGGRATAVSVLTPGSVQPALVKSQSVVAPDGSARATTGAIVTYTLEARFAAPTRGVVIADPVPAGTRFVAGSVTIDGIAQSDAAVLADVAAAATIRVTLGDIAAPVVRIIRFQTKID